MGTVNPSSASLESLQRRPGRPRIRLPIVPANGGDHAAIYFFLTGVFEAGATQGGILRGPTRNEFKASLEDPYYEPNDRLLIKSGGRIIAHGHLTHRQMQFGPVQIPVAGLGWLGTLPECRGKGHGRRLLRSAERRMAESGALVGLLRTSIPHFFRRTGWAVCGRHTYSRADARGVLARLLDKGLCKTLHKQRRQRLQIRPWRRWEEAALARIYNQRLEGTHGPLQRTKAYWQWLVERQAYDQIHVALDGPDLLDLREVNTRIVGYAATKGEKIVELLTAPGRRKASAELLARACGDAIEHDRHSVLLHAPASHPLHKVFHTAGGVCHDHESDGGEVYMARLLKPLKLLRLLRGQLHRRAERADLPRPLELGLLVDGKKFRLDVNRQSAQAVSRRLGNDYVRLNVADFTRMVLGQLDWSAAMADRRVEASDPMAGQAARALFPRLPLWHPPLDDLPA